MSGLPGKSLTWSRYRKPAAYRTRRTLNSGLVFAPFTALMVRVLCSGVSLSMIANSNVRLSSTLKRRASGVPEHFLSVRRLIAEVLTN